jgi:uncharacterized membrane protein (UPF0127 family)
VTTGALIDAASNRMLARRIVRADGTLARTVGLLRRRELEADEGMWFDRCSTVHTLGMRMAIDVVFLDRSGTVVAVKSSVPPWRPAVSAARAASVLELADGKCEQAGIVAGMRLELRWDSPI